MVSSLPVTRHRIALHTHGHSWWMATLQKPLDYTKTRN